MRKHAPVPFALALSLGWAPSGAVVQTVASDCPVTAEAPWTFAEPSPSTEAQLWYGSELLAVRLNRSGHWGGMGRDQNFGNKLFWWRQGYSGRLEPRPELVVKARPLDREGPAIQSSAASNAEHDDFGGWAMLVGMEFPETGCWEVTGRYHGERLTFVTLVP